MRTLRPPRRGAANLAMVVAVPLLAISACSGTDAGGSSAAAAGTPVSGGILTFAVNTDGSCLDPHRSPADVDGFFSRPILDSLVSLGTDGTIHPWLASYVFIPHHPRHDYTKSLLAAVPTLDGAAVRPRNAEVTR
jgi:peptide/nickel transport system substrate-binding protein